MVLPDTMTDGEELRRAIERIVYDFRWESPDQEVDELIDRIIKEGIQRYVKGNAEIIIE